MDSQGDDNSNDQPTASNHSASGVDEPSKPAKNMPQKPEKTEPPRKQPSKQKEWRARKKLSQKNSSSQGNTEKEDEKDAQGSASADKAAEKKITPEAKPAENAKNNQMDEVRLWVGNISMEASKADLTSSFNEAGYDIRRPTVFKKDGHIFQQAFVSVCPKEQGLQLLQRKPEIHCKGIRLIYNEYGSKTGAAGKSTRGASAESIGSNSETSQKQSGTSSASKTLTEDKGEMEVWVGSIPREASERGLTMLLNEAGYAVRTMKILRPPEYSTKDQDDGTVTKMNNGQIYLEGKIQGGTRNSPLRIVVKKGDITKERVDVIVNVTNRHFEPAGRFRKAICDAGGPEIQKEFFKYVKMGKVFREGDVIMARSGLLPCKMIAHAIVPVWNDGQRGRTESLQNAVRNCLIQSQRHGFESIAVPAVSPGLFGFSLLSAVPLIVRKAVTTAMDDGRGIKEIRFIDTGAEVVDAFADLVQKLGGFNENIKASPKSVQTFQQGFLTISKAEGLRLLQRKTPIICLGTPLSFRETKSSSQLEKPSTIPAQTSTPAVADQISGNHAPGSSRSDSEVAQQDKDDIMEVWVGSIFLEASEAEVVDYLTEAGYIARRFHMIGLKSGQPYRQGFLTTSRAHGIELIGKKRQLRFRGLLLIFEEDIESLASDKVVGDELELWVGQIPMKATEQDIMKQMAVSGYIVRGVTFLSPKPEHSHRQGFMLIPRDDGLRLLKNKTVILSFGVRLRFNLSNHSIEQLNTEKAEKALRSPPVAFQSTSSLEKPAKVSKTKDAEPQASKTLVNHSIEELNTKEAEKCSLSDYHAASTQKKPADVTSPKIAKPEANGKSMKPEEENVVTVPVGASDACHKLLEPRNLNHKATTDERKAKKEMDPIRKGQIASEVSNATQNCIVPAMDKSETPAAPDLSDISNTTPSALPVTHYENETSNTRNLLSTPEDQNAAHALATDEKAGTPLASSPSNSSSLMPSASLATYHKEETPNTVQVRGHFDPKLLLLYLRNTDRSGGGLVMEYEIRENWDWARVTFEQSSRAAEVVAKNNGRHTLKDQPLYLSILPPISKTKIFLDQIPEWVQFDMLRDYLESRTKAEIQDIIFRQDNKGALVGFTEPITIEALKEGMSARHLANGSHKCTERDLIPSEIPEPDAFLITNITSAFHEDDIIMHLEDKIDSEYPDTESRVRFVWKPKDEAHAIVIMSNHEIISKIGGTLIIDSVRLGIYPYYDCLGRNADTKGTNFYRKNKSSAVEENLIEEYCSVLSTEKARQMIDGKLKTQGTYCQWEISGQKLSVIAATTELSKTMKKTILDEVDTKKIYLDGPKNACLSSPEAATLFDELKSSSENTLIERRNAQYIILYGLTSELKAISDEIETFLERKSIYFKILVHVKGLSLYLKEMKPYLFHSPYYHMEFAAEGYIKIKGTVAQISTAEGAIEQAGADLQMAEYKVEKPGISSLLRKIDGQHRLDMIAKRTSTIIGEVSDLTKTYQDDGSVAGMNDGSIYLEGEIQRGKSSPLRIVVKKGDITKERVDVIVNAANRQLEHVGGLAKVICDAGGPEIQKECSRFVEKNKAIRDGFVFMGRSGLLPCKMIAHAVGPIWKDGKRGEKVSLQYAILNCLIQSHKRGAQSIAIPAISTGIFGYPLLAAVNLIVSKAVTTALNGALSIKEIRFIDTEQNAVDAFVYAVQHLYKFKEASKASPESVQTLPQIVAHIKKEEEPEEDISDDEDEPKAGQGFFYRISNFSRSLFGMSSRASDYEPPQSSAKATETATPGCIKIGSLNVKLIKGDIAQIAQSGNVDTVVNSVSKDSMLDGGAICKALAAAAGDSWTTSVYQKYPNGIRRHDVAVLTAPGRLRLDRLVHISLSDCKGQDMTDIATISNGIQQCLAVAARDGCRTIAIPPIGGGGLGYSPDVLAQGFITAIKSFPSHSKLELVQIVVHPKDHIISAALNEEIRKTQNGSTTGDDVYNEENGSSISLDFDHHPISNENSNKRRIDTVTIDSIKVEIVTADISEEKTDCILCPSDTDLSLNGGMVEKAIAQKADSNFELFHITPQSRETMKSTGLVKVDTHGCLPTKSVLFVNSPHSFDKWRQVLMKALKTSESSEVQTLSIPAVGTGKMGAKPELSAALMLETIQLFIAENKPNKLTSIRIIIFRDSFHQTFCQAVADITEGVDPAKPGPFQKALYKHFGEIDKKSGPQHEKPLTLAIYGTLGCINTAHQQLEKLCQELCPERAFSHGELHKLTAIEMRILRNTADAFNVDITWDETLKGVTICGVGSAEFETKLAKLLQDRADARKTDVAQPYTWYRMDDTTHEWKKLSVTVQRLLENLQMESGNKGVHILPDLSVPATVDFDAKLLHTEGKVYSIKRKELSDVTPVEWETNPAKLVDGFKLIDVLPGSKEYQDIVSTVNRTSVHTVYKIQRVENPSLYKKWHVEYERMKAANKREPTKQLFHGSKATNTDSICRDGFNRSYAGVNGVAYGQGSYFHKDFSYSQRYGNPVFLAKVLTGTYTVGTSDMKDTPMMPSGDRRYDSTVDQIHNPNIFVIYKDVNAYPAYAIYYR